MSLAMMADYALLMLGAFIAAVVSGSAGFGGALLLLPLLTRTVGVTDAVPLLTIAQLIGNLSRAWFGGITVTGAETPKYPVASEPACREAAQDLPLLPIKE